MSRIVDAWAQPRWDGTEILYRVLEDESGRRVLEVKGAGDPEFRVPARGHATALALRLMALRTEIPKEDGEAYVLAMRREKRA